MFWKINYGDICQLIRDTCLFTSRDMGYLVPPYTSLSNIKFSNCHQDQVLAAKKINSCEIFKMRSPRARANSMLHGCHAYINVQQYATRPNS